MFGYNSSLSIFINCQAEVIFGLKLLKVSTYILITGSLAFILLIYDIRLTKPLIDMSIYVWDSTISVEFFFLTFNTVHLILAFLLCQFWLFCYISLWAGA